MVDLTEDFLVDVVPAVVASPEIHPVTYEVRQDGVVDHHQTSVIAIQTLNGFQRTDRTVHPPVLVDEHLGVYTRSSYRVTDGAAVLGHVVDEDQTGDRPQDEVGAIRAGGDA